MAPRAGASANGRRVPPFEEVRGEVANRLEPQRKRKAFDDLIERLRKGAKDRVELSAAR